MTIVQLSKEEAECAYDLCVHSLYQLPATEQKKIETYPAFQILQKLRPEFLLSQSLFWKN